MSTCACRWPRGVADAARPSSLQLLLRPLREDGFERVSDARDLPDQVGQPDLEEGPAHRGAPELDHAASLRLRVVRPKNRRPFQVVPVIAFATAERLA